MANLTKQSLHLSPGLRSANLVTTGADMTINSRRMRVNDVELNVVVQGEGPDVLLVHGFPDDYTVWRNQIPALVDAGYRVIALDTRGCGESEIKPCEGDYAIDELVADLVALLDTLGIAKVRLVGHDFGALQAWYFAMEHPERVDRYIAMSVGHPAAYASGGVAQKLKAYYVFCIQLRGLIEFLVRRFDWWLFGVVLHYPAEFRHIRARLSRSGRLTAGFNYYRANLHLMLSKAFPRVKVPVVGILERRRCLPHRGSDARFGALLRRRFPLRPDRRRQSLAPV